MRALLRLLLGVAIVAFGAILAAWAYYFWTPMGRSSLKELAEIRLADAIGGDVSIGALEGKLPNEIILKNAVFSDEGNEWLRIDRAALHWNPYALFARAIDVASVNISDASLTATPPNRQEKENRPRGFELPNRLPHVMIDEIVISNLRIAKSIAGEDVRVDGAGDILTGGRDLVVNLSMTSGGERDYASARIERADDVLATELLIQSEAGGVIATIAGLGGPIYIEAKGDGPLTEYRLDLSSSLGAYGALNGQISGDLGRMERIDFDVDAALGERLANTARLIGSKASLQGAFSPLNGGGAIELSGFHSNLGTATANVSWRNRNDALEQVDIAAAATLDENWRPDLRPYIGHTIEIDGSVRPDGDNYSVHAVVTASLFDGVIKAAKTDLRTFARGPADVTLKKNPALPERLAASAKVDGDFTLVFGESIAGKALTLKTEEGGMFSGEAFYNFDTRAFTVKGDAAASPTMITALNPKLAAKLNASGVIDIKGHPESFGGTFAATTPPLQLDGKAIPAARLTLAFVDMPHSPSGQLTARAIDGSLRLKSNFARNASGAWRAEGIDYAGDDFAMKGAAAIDPEGGAIAVELSYRGVGEAEPWPGFSLVGDFTAEGAIARGDTANRLTVRSGALASRDWSVQDLSATIDGPSRRLSVKATSSAIMVKGAAPINKLSTEMTASLDKILDLRVTKLSGDLAGAPIALTGPAEISIDDGVEVRNFNAAIGRTGSLSLDGSITKARWRGVLVARRAPIVNVASIVDLEIDLDTDRKAPAAGTFSVSSLLTNLENATLSGSLSWNGRTLIITDDNAAEAFDLKLSLPAALTRAPSIRVSTKGSLSGAAHYVGRVETVAGFLPAALQSAEGKLEFSGSVSGDLSAPKMEGGLTISEGAFTELASGLSIVNIDATARADGAFSGSRIQFNGSASGVSQKEKTISATGVVTLGKERRLASQISFNNAKLSAGPVTEVTASGAIDLSGPFDQLLAKGDLTVKSLDARVFTPETTGLVDIKVVTLDDKGSPAPTSSAINPAAAINYAVRINGDDRIFIRGRGLTSEWRADVAISGRAEDPQILGTMTMKNGDITFAGRRFDMTKGEIAFDRLSVNNPSLDLRAERDTRSGTLAAITIEGRARTPKISLTSTPVLPPEDIMALILFDKPANELSAIESLQVAEGLAELGGIGPFGGNGVTGSARQALGLDLLNVDINQADSAASALTVGKYVAKGLFVSATQDARGENGSVRIEYEIRDSITVETELRQDGDQKASVNWKHDF